MLHLSEFIYHIERVDHPPRKSHHISSGLRCSLNVANNCNRPGKDVQDLLTGIHMAMVARGPMPEELLYCAVG